MFSDAGRMINKVNISAFRREGWRGSACGRMNGSGWKATCLSFFVSGNSENFK